MDDALGLDITDSDKVSDGGLDIGTDYGEARAPEGPERPRKA